MMNSDKLLEDIKKAVDRLGPEQRVDDAEYERRLNICKACDFLHEGTCDKCGCYVELRAATKLSDCPYHYWSKERRN